MSDSMWPAGRAKRSPHAKQFRAAGVHRPGGGLSDLPTKREDKLVPPPDVAQSYDSYLIYGFRYYWGRPHHLLYWPTEGWKFHIAATDRHAQDVLDLVAPKLVSWGVRHKFVPSLTALKSMTDEQEGKFITIYPQNLWQARLIQWWLCALLYQFPGYLKSAPRAPYDKPIGTSGILTTRYGAFKNSSIEGPKGEKVRDDRKGGYKPYWIDDPWEKNIAASPTEPSWPGKW